MNNGNGAEAVAVPLTGIRMADLVQLTKPRITLMNLLTAAGGFYLATPQFARWPDFINMLLATFLLISGACALNEYMERDVDGLMERTRNRPLPSGRLAPMPAFILGVVLSLVGVLYLGFAVNLLSGALGAIALASYVLIYTPMKRVSSLCTIVGAVPGALPPVIGWAAAEGRLGFGALVLFTIMFLWQLPHFLAIGWMYREDYERGGFPMLTVLDKDGVMTARQSLIFSLALLAAGTFPTIVGMTGAFYFVGSLFLGLAFVVLGVRWYLRIERSRAREVFFGSLIYLVVLFGLLVAGKV
ncbi:MAG: heme o synthase [Candidatus Sumerlaeaceae bacterium]|nr:heme o synthase [Candidatus Sumerlaeaceae bacterium]